MKKGLIVLIILSLVTFAVACQQSGTSTNSSEKSNSVEKEQHEEHESSESPKDAIESIRKNLDEMVKKYSEGNSDEAKDIVSKAYMEHFEGIEEQLEEKDHELMEELETLIANEFRAKIDKKASVDEIKSMAAKANKLLDKAEKVFK